MAERCRGLLVDYGGVLTTSLVASFDEFCRTEGLDRDALRTAFRTDRRAVELLIEFECGRLPDGEFEAALAERLTVQPDGLISRMFGHLRPEPAMIEAVAAARRAGVRTGLLSNSWGAGGYDRSRWDELFDAVVISGEEGMRKPDRRIYELAAERMGLPADAIVFVDDLPFNLEPARELGMAVVHHADAAATIAELERLLGIPLTLESAR